MGSATDFSESILGPTPSIRHPASNIQVPSPNFRVIREVEDRHILKVGFAHLVVRNEGHGDRWDRYYRDGGRTVIHRRSMLGPTPGSCALHSNLVHETTSYPSAFPFERAANTAYCAGVASSKVGRSWDTIRWWSGTRSVIDQ